MLTHKALVDYLKYLVDQSVDIDVKNFFRLNIAEIQGSFRSGVSFPCFAMESHEGNFEGSQSSNSVDNKTFAFTIYKKPQYNNFDQENQYLDDCEIIGKKFLARLRYDSFNPENLLHNLFDANLVSYHKVGPVFTEQLYGYRFEVSLKPDKSSLKVIAADWKDLDVVC